MFLIFWKILANGMKNKQSSIKVVAASVTGALHKHNEQLCQDCFQHATGRNFVAVVSDGAGSAKFGKIGARVVCSTLCDLVKNRPFEQAEQAVVHALKIAREKLIRHRMNKSKNEMGLADFAATVVGVVYRQGKGVFFHIGDGAAIALRDNQGGDFVASRPANGDFSCETFFFTQMAWAENLRFTNFDGAQSLFLMSDGLTMFSFSKDYREIEKGFILPINDFLSKEKMKSRATRALANTLNTPRAQKLNPDDKTLIWAKVQ